MRIFLDVGAHHGESMLAAMDPALRFDRIFCFEPVRSCWPILKTASDARVRIERFGLWNKTSAEKVFQPGSKGAGIWKKNNGTSDVTELCKFIRASDWTAKNLTGFATVFLKLNCEGAECDIVEDLIDSGEFAKITFTMIDFDVRKIDAMKHRQAETLAKLKAAGARFPNVASSKDVMQGATHRDRIQHWIRYCDSWTCTK